MGLSGYISKKVARPGPNSGQGLQEFRPDSLAVRKEIDPEAVQDGGNQRPVLREII